VLVRASDDLKRNMVTAETIEQFQRELDQKKVRSTSHHRPHTALHVVSE